MRSRRPSTGRATRSYAPDARPSRSLSRTSPKTSSDGALAPGLLREAEAGRPSGRPPDSSRRLAAAALHRLHAIAAIHPRPVAAGSPADVIATAPVRCCVHAVVAAAPVQAVAALVAVQPVASAVAVDAVVAVAAGGVVLSGPRQDAVVAASPLDAVVAAEATDHVALLRAHEPVALGGPDDRAAGSLRTGRDDRAGRGVDVDRRRQGERYGAAGDRAERSTQDP